MQEASTVAQGWLPSNAGPVSSVWQGRAMRTRVRQCIYLWLHCTGCSCGSQKGYFCANNSKNEQHQACAVCTAACKVQLQGALACRVLECTSSEDKGCCHTLDRTLHVCKGTPSCPRSSPRLLALMLGREGWPIPAQHPVQHTASQDTWLQALQMLDRHDQGMHETGSYST